MGGTWQNSDQCNLRGQSWNIILKQSSYWPFAHLDHLEQSCWPAVCGCHKNRKIVVIGVLAATGSSLREVLTYVLSILCTPCGAFLDASSPGTFLKTRMQNKIYEKEGPPRNNLVQGCCCPPSFQAVTKASFIVQDPQEQPQGPFEIQHVH